MQASIVHMLIARQVRQRLQEDADPETLAFFDLVLEKYPAFMDLGALGLDSPYHEKRPG